MALSTRLIITSSTRSGSASPSWQPLIQTDLQSDSLLIGGGTHHGNGLLRHCAERDHKMFQLEHLSDFHPARR
jgi:hypothetical protein